MVSLGYRLNSMREMIEFRSRCYCCYGHSVVDSYWLCRRTHLRNPVVVFLWPEMIVYFCNSWGPAGFLE